MTTRVMEINKPRFSGSETRELLAGKPICIFGVAIEHRFAQWFRLDAPSIQSLEHVLAILTGGYVSEE